MTYGSPRITKELKAKGIRCIENRVARLMRREGICAKMVKKFKMITDSDHTYPVFPNLLKQNFYAPGPNQVWVSDITYNPNRPRVAVSLRSGGPVLPTDCGVCHPYMSADLAKEALFMACQRRNPRKGVIFHTDRGSQYARHTFQQAISKRGFIPSMSRKGNCDDNTAIESFFHTGLPSTSYTLKQYLLSRFITRSTLSEQCFLFRVRFLSMG